MAGVLVFAVLILTLNNMFGEAKSKRTSLGRLMRMEVTPFPHTEMDVAFVFALASDNGSGVLKTFRAASEADKVRSLYISGLRQYSKTRISELAKKLRNLKFRKIKSTGSPSLMR